ncbi:30S ribosomal protein [Dirofilaria immitis]
MQSQTKTNVFFFCACKASKDEVFLFFRLRYEGGESYCRTAGFYCMPNGPMEGFLTRRSVAVFTSSLAFAIIYWYIRRRRSLKYSASDNRNTKINAKSHSQKSFESDSKRIAVASVMKPNDGIRDGKPSDNFGNVRLESNQFISELSDDVIIAELENDVINAKTVSVAFRVSSCERIAIVRRSLMKKKLRDLRLSGKSRKPLNTPSSEVHYFLITGIYFHELLRL